MKGNIILVVLSGLFLISCSSTSLKRAWKDQSFAQATTNKTLIIVKSKDQEVRKAYENELAAKLKKKGYLVVVAHQEFPDLRNKENRTESEIANIIDSFREKGIQNVMITSLKNIKTVTPEPENNQTVTTNPIITPRPISVTFLEYYTSYSSTEYLTETLRPRSGDAPQGEYIEFLSSTVYNLETLIYDITKKTDNQLIGRFQVEASDPSSAQDVLNKFTTLIAKQF